MHLQPDVIESAFDPGTYQRGHRYFLQGRVTDLTDTRSGSSLHYLRATVSGSGNQWYHTTVTVDTMAPWWLHAACTCPVGSYCKHAVAVLLAARAEAEKSARPTLSREEVLGIDFREWLNNVRQRKALPSRNTGLVFLLDTDDSAGDVTISCQKVNILKSGKLGKARSVMPWHRPDLEQSPPGYVQKPDIEPLLWIQQLVGFNRPTPVVRGIAGARFLASALETERLVWARLDNCPFSRGEPVTAELLWQQDNNGNFLLSPSTRDGLVLLPTDPPWYLDIPGHKAGPLSLPMDTDTWFLLLDAPPIPPTLLEKHARELSDLLAPADTALPETIRLPEEVRDAPVPVLQLFQIPGPQSSPLKIARLRFDYGGLLLEEYDVSGEDPVRHMDDAQSLLIFRDIAFERQCVENLEDFLFLFELDRTWAESLPDRMDLDQTLPAPSQWLDFLAWELPRLTEAGWRIEMDDSFDVPVAEASDWYGRTEASDQPGWFEVELGIEHDGRRIDLIPLLEEGLQHLDIGVSLDDNEHLDLPENLWLHDGESLIRVSSDRVRPMLETLVHLFHRGFSATTDEGRLSLPRLDAAMLAGTSAAQWESGDQLRKLGQQLAGFTGLATVEPPEGLNATLRHYQQDGLNWLNFLRQAELGGVLADDMGLGKTLQTLACILEEKQSGRLQQPALVVCPTSVIPNWKAEAARFTPGLRVLVIHGPKRQPLFDQAGDTDLIITSYPLLHRDVDHHEALAYSMAFFDEAQNLKNPKAAVSKAARRLTATNRIALTGTPMENHLGELWSLFDLVLPGYLGTGAEFREFYRNPLERNGDQDQHYHLGRRIHPFLLRRTKDQVTPELPEKTEMVKLVELNSVQKDLYETVRASMNAKIRQLMNEKGVARSQIEILEALLKLRQICCHPDLLRSSEQPLASAKLDYLLGMITELLEEGRRIIVFSQFTSMLTILEKTLTSMGLDYVKLTGKTQNREKPVQDFQAGKVPLFLISLKAGGAGLNLTAADCVIHYDPWWNPAVEQQATDRAWRIGQDKPVFVYRLICEGTVEERIQALQERKARLADGLYGKAGKFSAALTAEDVQVLFQPLGRE
ncbi:SNF2-related protein [Marinobacter lacisalsi]|uniref:SNF2-related protein n=1 Tax=Marinobacter lacisalsi TaxID=475979 RepID=A0ABV8QK81_9GAMM